LHSFVVTSQGEWVVVQQGMNGATGMARRYHWHSAALKSFVQAPHSGIAGEPQGKIMNLVDPAAAPAQGAILEVLRQEPAKNLNEISKSKISPEFISRLEHLEPHQKVRAIILVQAEGAEKLRGKRQSRAERQAYIEAMRKSAEQALGDIDKILRF
jgi:hypothetical protein